MGSGELPAKRWQEQSTEPTRFGSVPPTIEFALSHGQKEIMTMRYMLLWLIGIPIPVLIVIYLMFH